MFLIRGPMHILNITQLKGPPCFMPLNILIILLLVPFIKSFIYFVMVGNCYSTE